MWRTTLPNLIAEGELVRAAQMATKPLAAAVKYLQKYYPAFEGSKLITFNFWDECAHEKLLFIRNNPFGRGAGLSDGVELDGAHAAWQTQRQTFQKAGTIANASATLNQILTENAKLADPSIGLNPQAVQTSIQTVASLYNDLSAAQKAVQALVPR